MITLYTIGFTKKSAEKFFNLLRNNNVKQLVDIRISNSSQLAGFAKGSDLAFFAKEICHIPYTHIVDFAPTKELLDKWHKNEVSWIEYEKIYTKMLTERNILQKYGIKKFDGASFLCSEDTPENCHRRLLAEYMQKHSKEDLYNNPLDLTMDKYFICLANSYKRGGRCIAGIEVLYNSPNDWSILHNENGSPKWIRPIAHTAYGEIPNNLASKIKYFSIVKLLDVTPCPKEIHIEDFYYYNMVVSGQIKPSVDLLSKFVDCVHDNIFFNHGKAIPSDIHFPDAYSLMLIRPENVSIYTDNNWDKPKIRMKIIHCGVSYDFPVTDPVFLDAYRTNPCILQNAENIFLTLSLGLDYEGWHHKLIATVFYNIQQSIAEEKTILKSTQSGWIVKEERSFTYEETESVRNAVVVANQNGNSVCFYMKAGGQCFFPLTPDSEIGVGENVELADLQILTLCKGGTDDIMRVRYCKRETVVKSYMYIQKQLHANAYSKWTTEDDSALMQMHRDGVSINEMMEKFGRNEGSIKSRILKLEASSAPQICTDNLTPSENKKTSNSKSIIETIKGLFKNH